MTSTTTTTTTTGDDIRDLVHEASRIAQEGGTEAERQEFAARKAAVLAGIGDSATTVSAQLLFPQPLSDFPRGYRVEEGDPEGTITLYGYGAGFCEIEGPPHGSSVAEHGPYCESPTGLAVKASTSEGTPVGIYGDLVKAYRHGVYSAPLTAGADDALVQLRVIQDVYHEGGDVQLAELNLRPSQVRSLAAGLVHLADRIELHHEDLVPSPRRTKAMQAEATP